MIVFTPSTEAGHLNLDERTAPLFTLTLLIPSKRSEEERMKLQLNLSTTATLGTEKSDCHKALAFCREVTQESLYGLFFCREKKSGHCKEVAVVE